MSSFELVIDQRERDILEVFKKEQVDYIVETLDIGDFLIRDKETKQDVLLIERKTKSDLAASIVDNRYKEQKLRIVEHYIKKGVRVIYLVEKFYVRTAKERVPHKSLLAALVNMYLRDQIMTYHSGSLQDSVEFITELFKKAPQFIKTHDQPSSPEESDDAVVPPVQKTYTSVIQKKRGDNIVPDNFLVVALCQVPKVGNSVAKAISEEYSSLSELISKFSEVDKPELLLSEIQVGKRRVGKIVSKQIYDFFTNTSV